MASCEKRGIGDIQPAAPGLQMLQMVRAKANLEITYCWILAISSDNSKYMDSQKELKVSQTNHPFITSIFFWEKLQEV